MSDVLRDLLTFLLAQPLTGNKPSIYAAISNILLLDFLVSIGCLVIVYIVVGKPRADHALKESVENNGFFKTAFEWVLVGVAEEIIFRVGLFGVLFLIFRYFLSYTISFYIALLFSAGSFALLHLLNFKQATDRQIIRVLPQLFGGFAYAYLFFIYGLKAAIIAHVLFNLICCCLIFFIDWLTSLRAKIA